MNLIRYYWIFVLCNLSLHAGEGSLRVPEKLKDTEILDKRGTRIPKDIRLIDNLGNSVLLGDYFGKKPLILTLGYYKCPMLCSLVLNALVDSIRGQSLKLGEDFDILSVSIDPKDTPRLAHEKRVNYLKALGLSQESPWIFALGQEDQVKKLANSVGFGYRYDLPSKEFIHSAGIFIISPEGVLSRVLYGISYKPNDLKLSLIDASHGKIGSLLDRLVLTCFHYDPDSHKYGVYIFGVMRIAGVLTILILGAFLFILLMRERRLKTWI